MKDKAIVLPIIFLFILFISLAFLTVFESSISPVKNEEKESIDNKNKYDFTKELFYELKTNSTTKKTLDYNIKYNSLINNKQNEIITRIIPSKNKTISFNVDTDIPKCEDEEVDDSQCKTINIIQKNQYVTFITEYNYLDNPTIYGYDAPFYFSSNFTSKEGGKNINAEKINNFLVDDGNNVSINIYTINNQNRKILVNNDILSINNYTLAKKQLNIKSKGYNTVSLKIETLIPEKYWNRYENKEFISNIQYNSDNSYRIKNQNVSSNEVTIEFDNSRNYNVFFYENNIN